jgi:hypothetical protein
LVPAPVDGSALLVPPPPPPPQAATTVAKRNAPITAPNEVQRFI